MTLTYKRGKMSTLNISYFIQNRNDILKMSAKK